LGMLCSLKIFMSQPWIVLSFCFKVWGKVSFLFYYFHIWLIKFFYLIGNYLIFPFSHS
jgi:hypothetical protein